MGFFFYAQTTVVTPYRTILAAHQRKRTDVFFESFEHCKNNCIPSSKDFVKKKKRIDFVSRRYAV